MTEYQFYGLLASVSAIVCGLCARVSRYFGYRLGYKQGIARQDGKMSVWMDHITDEHIDYLGIQDRMNDYPAKGLHSLGPREIYRDIREKHATVKDVARLLGVSVMTVRWNYFRWSGSHTLPWNEQ